MKNPGGCFSKRVLERTCCENWALVGCFREGLRKKEFALN